MFSGLIARFGLKVLSSGALIVILVVAYFTYSCKQKIQDKRITEHNNQKAEKQIETEVDRTEVYSEKEKLKNERPTALKSDTTYYKKDSGKKIKKLPRIDPKKRKKNKEKEFNELEGGLL